MSPSITRRSLLGRSASAAAFLILPNSASVRSAQANERLNIAHIGCGGRGRELLLAFPNSSNTVALCDVNDNKATEMYRKFPNVPKFRDFREMLDKMANHIDAVVVATPDHTHAVASAAAIRLRKHVYTEKPLSRTVSESRTLRLLARQFNVATSMGNQGTASNPFRRAVELIRNGAIGQVKEVHVWNDSGGADRRQTPTETAKVPPYLDWNLWLGPAQLRPFHPTWLAWRQWRDFGTSQLGNWASHTANLAFMALNVASLWSANPPTKPVIRVHAQCSSVNRLSFPKWETVTWLVPTRQNLPQVPFHWYNGSSAPHSRDTIESLIGRGLDWGDKGDKKWADFAGCLIIGTDGHIHATGHNATFTLFPEEKAKNLQKTTPEILDRSAGHEQDFLAACRGQKPAWANYDYAAPLNEFLQLGNLATLFPEPLDYDPLSGQILNNPQANAALHPEYRDGWTL